MENQYPPIVVQILTKTEKYLEKYGRCLIGLYYFPQPLNGNFLTFVYSLRTSLFRHHDGIPSYAWKLDSVKNGYYLIIWQAGSSYRMNLDDLPPVISSLWSRQSSEPWQQINTFNLIYDNYYTAINWLAPLLLEMGATQTDGPKIPIGKHIRTYAISRN